MQVLIAFLPAGIPLFYLLIHHPWLHLVISAEDDTPFVLCAHAPFVSFLLPRVKFYSEQNTHVYREESGRHSILLGRSCCLTLIPQRCRSAMLGGTKAEVMQATVLYDQGNRKGMKGQGDFEDPNPRRAQKIKPFIKCFYYKHFHIPGIYH